MVAICTGSELFYSTKLHTERVKLNEGALDKSVRSALQTRSMRAPSGCALNERRAPSQKHTQHSSDRSTLETEFEYCENAKSSAYKSHCVTIIIGEIKSET